MSRLASAAFSVGPSPLYKRAASLREGWTGCLGAGLMVAVLACGGCSTARVADDDTLITGSIRPVPATLRLPEGEAPQGIAPGDWNEAKRALDVALAAAETDISVPWENAETGARGTATPVGPRRGGGCRDFMIAVVDGRSPDRWVQGEACRGRSGTVLSQVRLLGRA